MAKPQSHAGEKDDWTIESVHNNPDADADEWEIDHILNGLIAQDAEDVKTKSGSSSAVDPERGLRKLRRILQTRVHPGSTELFEQHLNALPSTPGVLNAREQMGTIERGQHTLSDVLGIAFLANEGIVLQKTPGGKRQQDEMDFEEFEKEFAATVDVPLDHKDII